METIIITNAQKELLKAVLVDIIYDWEGLEEYSPELDEDDTLAVLKAINEALK